MSLTRVLLALAFGFQALGVAPILHAWDGHAHAQEAGHEHEPSPAGPEPCREQGHCDLHCPTSLSALSVESQAFALHLEFPTAKAPHREFFVPNPPTAGIFHPPA